MDQGHSLWFTRPPCCTPRETPVREPQEGGLPTRTAHWTPRRFESRRVSRIVPAGRQGTAGGSVCVTEARSLPAPRRCTAWTHKDALYVFTEPLARKRVQAEDVLRGGEASLTISPRLHESLYRVFFGGCQRYSHWCARRSALGALVSLVNGLSYVSKSHAPQGSQGGGLFSHHCLQHGP